MIKNSIQHQKNQMTYRYNLSFNEWTKFVQFGSKCDQTQFKNFIEKYENAIFNLRETTRKK